MSLSMIYSNKLQSAVVQEMVQNSKTIQLLQKYNEGQMIEDTKNKFKKEIQQEFDASAKNQAQNKQIFHQKYGFECEIPTLYLMDAKIFPTNVRYILKVIKYVIPNSTQEVQELKNGKITKTTFAKIYEDSKYCEDDSVLQLIKIEDNSRVSVIQEVRIENSVNVEIAFSPNGKFFALFRKAMNNLQIYTIDKNQGIVGLMSKVEKQEHFRQFDNYSTLKEAQKLYFDRENRYLVSYGLIGVNIIDLQDLSEMPHHILIDSELFSSIIDLQFVSSAHGTYRCDLLCQSSSIQVIQICKLVCLDFVPELPLVDKKRVLSYLNPDVSELQVKISQDFESIMMTNGNENYYFGRENKKGEFYQRGIPSLNKKNLNFIYSEGENFYFITSKDFDDNIKVELSSDESFERHIPKKIQPGILKVHDVVHKDGEMIILDSVGEQFNIEIVNPQDQGHKPISIQQDFFNQKIMWPYVCQQGFRDFFWIIDAFNPNIIHRIFLPEEGFMLQEFFIYDFRIYFLLMSKVKKCYQLQSIDMRTTKDKFQLTNHFQYSFKEVGEKPFLDFFVRGESRERDQQQNLKLIVFFLHEGKLFQWTKGLTLQPVCETVSEKLQFFSNNEFIFRTDDKDSFCLKKVKIMFSYFSTHNFFQEKQHSDCLIKSYAFDQEAMMLITLNKVESRKNYKQRLIKIFDLTIGKQLISFNTVDETILGRFTSGLFHIVNGHFYFGNQVIKIRYDLIRKSQTTKLNDSQIFDEYDNLFDLQGGQEILAQNPIVCREFNRMAYFSINFKQLKPKKLTVIPYMHERKIYLNKQKPGNSYFYTTIEELPEDQIFDSSNQFVNTWKQKVSRTKFIISMDMDRHTYYVMSDKGILLNKVDFSDQVELYGTPVQVSANGKNFVFQDKKNKFKINLLCLGTNSLIFVKSFDVQQSISQYIIDLELQEDLTYQERADASKLRSNYDGDFKAFFIPENVKIYIRINDNLDVAVQLSSKQEQKIQQELAKAFNSDDVPTLWQYFSAQTKEESESHKMRLSQESKAVLKGMQGILKIRIKASIQASKGSIYYIQKAPEGLQEKRLSVRQLSFFGKNLKRDSKPTDNQLVFFTKDHDDFIIGQDRENFELNSNYLICWNHFGISTLNLGSTVGKNGVELKRLSFVVDPLEKQTYIKYIRVGSNASYIMIVVRQSKTSDFVLHWDLQKNVETVSFDQKSDPIIFFDAKGDSYITEDETVIICKQNLGLLAFDVKKANTKNQRNRFGYHYGHRFDDVNHNWILFNEYLSLSFSYMTLVIRDKNQASNNYLDPNYIFDQEEYNFVINRKTCFTCDNFVGNDYEKLQFVLKNMLEENKVLLQQLYYYYLADPKDDHLEMLKSSSHILKDTIFGEEDHEAPKELKITPLHLAFFEGNNRSINVILKYMSFLNCDCSHNIKDILPSLINQENFLLYMQELPFRTIQMENKQTLRVYDQFNDEIVKVEQSCSGYTDDLYFKNIMKEDKEKKNYKNFPVNIWALKCNWIIDSEEGGLLLEQLLLSEKHELYECRTIKVIVEFLYMYYRELILWQRLPVYIFQLIIYFAAILLNERSMTNNHDREIDLMTQEILDERGLEGDLESWKDKVNIHDHILNTSKYSGGDDIAAPNLHIFFAVLNLISCLYSLTIIYIQSKKQFKTFFRTVWAYFDIFYVIMNGLVSISFLNKDFIEISNVRRIESVLSVIIVAKLVYFTQLIDEIAPLVNIIIRIFYDIFWFMLILIIAIFSYANSFYLLGQNQDYQVYLANQKQRISDLITGEFSDQDDMEVPGYVKFHGALRHVYLLALGEFNLDDYAMGDGSDNILLWFFFISASFFMMIHLLNMLIAIMGETFAKFNEIKSQQTIRNHLRFVIDNQWRDPLEHQRSQITYLIAAFVSFEENKDTEVLNNLQEEMSLIKATNKKENQKLMFEIQQVKTLIENLNIESKEN